MRKRSKFNLSHYNNLSFKMGYLVPVDLLEVLPGDSIQWRTSTFMRLAPQNAPVMHPVHAEIKLFYCPSRILWPMEDGHGFESFITGGPDGQDDSVFPTISLTPTVGSLADYFGLPLTSSALTVNALPFRAYGMIYNEYFRDQDLQSEVAISLGSGPDSTTQTSLLRPCWAKDYFTTARPWPQKGDAVTIPLDLGEEGESVVNTTTSITSNGTFKLTSTSANPYDTTIRRAKGTAASALSMSNGSNLSPDLPLTYASGLKATSVSTLVTGDPAVGGLSVAALREAMALQRMQEARALYGSRYEDLLRFYGVRPQDARLQHPEYLGGSSQTVQFSEVLQTSAGEAGGVGDLYGHGVSAGRSLRIRRFIPEHGYIMAIMFVRPISVYTQGLERMWTRAIKEDFWQKELQHIGQQEVLSQELFADGSAADKTVFGYQNRYDEYRRGVNRVCGEFRTVLDYWHMARIFDNRPVLNSDFVTSTPTDRIFQATADLSDQLYCMVKHDIIAKRLVDRTGSPI